MGFLRHAYPYIHRWRSSIRMLSRHLQAHSIVTFHYNPFSSIQVFKYPSSSRKSSAISHEMCEDLCLHTPPCAKKASQVHVCWSANANEQVTGPDERIIYSVSKETEGKFTVRSCILHVCHENNMHACECWFLVFQLHVSLSSLSACGNSFCLLCTCFGSRVLRPSTCSVWLTWSSGAQFIASDTGLYRCCFGNFMSTVTVSILSRNTRTHRCLHFSETVQGHAILFIGARETAKLTCIGYNQKPIQTWCRTSTRALVIVCIFMFVCPCGFAHWSHLSW
jgi:hypothetical protein